MQECKKGESQKDERIVDLPKVSILVTDDHSFIRAATATVLNRSRFQIVAGTATCEETLGAIETHDPVIVLLDIDRFDINGVQVLEALCARSNRRSVVMLTAEITDCQLILMLCAGVDGIVLKDGAETALIDALEKISTGQKSISASLLQRTLDISLNLGAGSPLDRFKSRERRISRPVTRGLRNPDKNLASKTAPNRRRWQSTTQLIDLGANWLGSHRPIRMVT